ncbi:MAG: hypothetical protein N2Z76_01720 [Treponemataceae bacterium]|nr:hypothetical protein [Treponemataceae bacterium]
MTKGLLQRAQDMVEETPAIAGISAEDQQEIRAQIEALTKRQGLEASQHIPFRPTKRGFVFPLLINVFLLGGTTAALWFLAHYFSQQEKGIVTTRAQVYTAEGKLIQQIKQETEQKLSQKAAEIARMQDQLARLEEENRKTTATFEERLKAKEAEIREKIKQEVANERIRLEAQGLAEAIIAERLKKFEAERQTYYAQQLEAFKQQLAREQAEAEATYNRLRSEYLKNIQGLQQERQKIQQEALQREQQLRSNLEEKNRQLAAMTSQIASGEAQLERARSELARLEEQRKARAIMENQVAGFYQTIQKAYQERKYEEALRQVSRCIAYLTSEPLLRSTDFQQRREMDLFAMETIGNFIRSQIEKTTTDQGDLLKQVERLTVVQRAVAEAREALNRGALEEGQQAYLRALSTIPEVLESHQYLLARRQEEEQQKFVTAMKQLGEGNQARREGNYERAASAYTRALTLLGVSEGDSKLLLESLSALGRERWQKEQIEADTRSSASLVRQAQRLLRQENWIEALRSYTEVLAKYPATREQSRILTDIDTILLNLGKKQEVAVENLQRKIEDLQKQTESLTKALEQEKLAGGQKDLDLETQKKRVAELEKALELAQSQSALPPGTAGAPPDRTTTGINSPTSGTAPSTTSGGRSGSLPGGTESSSLVIADYERIKQENERLRKVVQEYDRLTEAYRTYRTAEDSLLSRGGTASLVEARGSLESFLTEPAVRRIFPDLRERILRYEKEFVGAGQRESIYLIRDIVETTMRLPDPRSRTRYLEGLRSRYQDNEAMKSLIESLQKNLGT